MLAGLIVFLIFLAALLVRPSFCPPALCEEISITDLALVYFTYCLVIVGLFQMWNTDETAKRTQRAYVFGGSPFGPVKSEWVEPLKNGEVFPEARYYNDPRQMTINNYGKTPAFITSVEYGFCDELPKCMLVSKAMNRKLLSFTTVPHPSNVYPPTGSGVPIYRYRHVQFNRAEHEGKIFFGRIWYTDVFHEKHFSTFSLRLTKEGFSNPVGDSYTDDWD